MTNNMNSLCLTCLANAVNCVLIPQAIQEFLQDILNFKYVLRMQKDLPNLVCLPCYKTLSEMKRFYLQLHDVEHYFKQMEVKWTMRKQDISQKGNAYYQEIPHAENSTTQFPTNTKDAANETVYNVHEVEDIDPANEIAGNEKVTEELCEDQFVDPGTEDSFIDYSQSTLDSPYRCKTCVRVFESADYYQKHMQWHTAHEKGCCKRPATRPETFQHSKVSTYKAKVYQCDGCTQKFLLPAHLQKHKLKQGEAFKCSVCGKMYCNVETLDAHTSVAHFWINEKFVHENNTKAKNQKSQGQPLVKDDDSLLVEEDTEALLE